VKHGLQVQYFTQRPLGGALTRQYIC